jgi:hypothetical protein
MFKLFVLKEGYNYSDIITFISEGIHHASDRFTVKVMFMVDEQNDVVEMNVFNAETIEQLIIQTVDYFLKDYAECIAEGGDMLATMSIEFTE